MEQIWWICFAGVCFDWAAMTFALVLALSPGAVQVLFGTRLGSIYVFTWGYLWEAVSMQCYLGFV